MLENQELQEGINDTAIFKAVFLAGGPGSGKSFIGTEKKGKSPTAGGDPKIFMSGGQLGLINLGLRVVNPDPAYEKLLKDAGLDAKNSADIWSDKGQEIRVKATDLTAKQKSLYVDGRLGVVVDGTGANINKIKGQKSLLDKVGYECAMIYVNTNLETAIARDAKRDRTIGADKVTEMWNNVQKNLKSYEGIFGKSNMYIIDNSDGSNWNVEAKKAHKKLEKWIRKDPTDPKAKAWIEAQKMRNAPKSGIKEEDSNYLPGYSTGFYGHDPYTPRARMQELHHDIRRCSSINDACNEVSEKWHEKLAELSKTNATHLDDLDDEDIAILLPYAEEMRKEQMSLSEGFMDTFLGRNMKKGNVDKKKVKKSKNSEQVKLSTEIDRKLRLIDDLMKKVRPLGGNLGRLMSFRKLPIDKMTPKGMYIALNDWWSSIEDDLDDDSEDDNEKYAQSAEKLYDLWEEVGFKLSDYMWASGYNIKGIGQMAKIGFPAKKRTDPEWLKMNESVDEGFMDTFMGRDMKKGNVARQNPIRTLGKLGKNNKGIVRKIIEETRRFEKAINGELFGTRLQRQETSKFMKSLRNDSTTMSELAKDFENALHSWNAALDNSIENELLDPIDEDYWQDKIYLVKDLVKKILSEMWKIDESVELDENFIAFDYDHEVLTHFQTKADGMKWKNHKNAPDSYYLVKTKHRLLKGDMASDGSDSLSKHLDSQPFPEKDGANFSVHKESVELDEKGPKVDMKKYAAHMDRNKKKKTMSSTKKNLSSIAKRAEKKANEARDKFLNIETQLDELSPKTKKSYSDKATRAVDNEKKYAEKYSDAAKADPENPKYKKRADAHKRKAKNRAAGMKNANLDELSMTKADLSKTGMKVDTKKMAELKKELARLKKGLKKESIDESTRFENESAEMVMRDLLIMQNKIIDLVEMMDIEMGASEMEELGLEPWVVAKITKAKDYLDSIHDYTVMDNDNDE